MKGEGAGAAAHGWGEGRRDDRCLCPLPPPPPGPCNFLGVVQKSLPNSRPEKAGVCGRENKKYNGPQVACCSGQLLKCSPEFTSFVLGREQAPGPGSGQGKKPWCQVDAGGRVGRCGVEPAVRLVHRGFGAKGKGFLFDPGTRCLSAP